MGWDGAIHARIQVPAAQREAWLDCELDWRSVDGHEAWDGPVYAATVREVVEDMAFASEVEFLEFEWDGDELRVASFQSEDGFRDTALAIAAAWAAAAALGGRGELIAMGMLTAAFGYRLVVGDGTAKFSTVPKREVSSLDRHPDAKAIKARLMGIADAEMSAAKKPAGKKKSAAKKKPAAKKKHVAKKKGA